jgi:hypothetical protein
LTVGNSSALEDSPADPAERLDRAVELVGVDARVALGRVEVLVAEQLLDLAKVRARVEELRGEDMPQRVRRHAFALADAACLDVVAEELVELRVF